MLYLFFDSYIVSPLSNFYPNSTRRGVIDNFIRSSCHSYRYQSKCDIVRYTLSTYSYLPFDGAIVRVECEDETCFSRIQDIINPNWSLQANRSATALTYMNVLSESFTGNPWIFFSPNNDHPFIGTSTSLITDLLNRAEFLERKYSNYIVSVLYSHIADMINMTGPSKGLWGQWDFIFPKIIYEDHICYGLELNKFCGDSIQIFRRHTLINLFSADASLGNRVIRLEDLSSYFSSKIKHIMIVPKNEICRHFDASFHTDRWPSFERAPQPLIIPDGFFDKKIKINYRSNIYIEDHVNIDPWASRLRYLNPTGPDLNINKGDIPIAWLDRIITLLDNDINIIDEGTNFSFYRYFFTNAWAGSPRFYIYFLSYVRLFTAPVRYLFTRLHMFLYAMLHKFYFYKFLSTRYKHKIPFLFNHTKLPQITEWR